MSIRKPSAAEFRQQYLANLSLETTNNQKNAGANQLFKQTGQIAQPTDNRSITDKLADIEGLKVSLRSELSRLTDGAEISSILTQMTPDDIRFAYEQFTGIEKGLSGRFKTGVPAEAFLNFLERYKENFLQTGGVEATVAEQLEPLTSAVLTKNLGRNRQAAQGATKDYVSTLQGTPLPANFDGIAQSVIRKLMADIKKELYRQLIEEPNLDQGQINKRRALWDLLGNGQRPVAQGGTGGTKATDYIAWIAANPQEWGDLREIMGQVAGAGISGCGLVKKPRPFNLQGVPKAEFIPFGRYKMDVNKLVDDIFSIKKPCGANVPDLPTHRMTKRVSNSIKQIVGGSIPSYDDILEMNDDERGFLHNLARKSRINDRVKIPAPNKDAQQKEMDRFDILKGQILAGNDNKELIKEFKLKMLKLCKDGRIPRREVNEIMYDLMSVGL
jgi:hypothetical protein